ncbi:MAG: hypothetical protein M1812_001936 [Candelaria pacifica]|nr:MAG: hypothetical protein M1812_001936 [Candelaria pacifica]
MPIPWLTLALFSTFVQLTVAQATLHDNAANCSCFVTDGVQPATYLYHRFFDFRNISSSLAQGQYSKSSAWTNDWYSQNWGTDATDDTPVRMLNDPKNVFIAQRSNLTKSDDANRDNLSISDNADRNNVSKSDDADDYNSYLTLRTVRLPDFQSAAEVESLQKNLMYASIRLRARVIGDAGACAGMFTVYNDDNESDIEILTMEPKDKINYSNQPTVDNNGEVIPLSGVDAVVPTNWTDWNDHRLDWLPHKTSWYINGVHTVDNTYSVPREASCLTMNMWSNGGEGWTGKMRVGGSAELQIQWIDMVFNTSGPVTGPPGATTKKRDVATLSSRLMRRKRAETPCKVACAVDGVKKVGFPEVVRNSTATSLGLHSYEVSKRATLASLLTGSLLFTF